MENIYITYEKDKVTGAFGFKPENDFISLNLAEWNKIAKYGIENLIIVDGTIKVTASAFEKQVIQQKVNEALTYLARTDKKVLPYYDFEEGEDNLEQYVEARRIARQFVRDNQNA